MFAQHVENEAAYEAAIRARITLNARKGWIARDPSRLDTIQWLQSEAARRPGSFLAKMFDTLEQWGKLTEKQEAAVLKIRADNGAKLAQWKAERAAQDAGSQHVGLVGGRMVFANLTVRFVTSFEGMYGTTYVTGLADEAGNVVIYKGSNTVGEKGDIVSLKATVKAHGEREGVKQTIIARPSVLA